MNKENHGFLSQYDGFPVDVPLKFWESRLSMVILRAPITSQVEGGWSMLRARGLLRMWARSLGVYKTPLRQWIVRPLQAWMG